MTYTIACLDALTNAIGLWAKSPCIGRTLLLYIQKYLILLIANGQFQPKTEVPNEVLEPELETNAPMLPLQ